MFTPRRSLIAALLMIVPACGATAKPAPPRPATCEAVAAAVAVQLHDDAFAALTKPAAAPDAFARSLAAQVGASCATDAWPLATRQCLVDATDDAGITGCAVTADQRAHLAAAIEPLADQHAIEALRDQVCACTTRACADEAIGAADRLSQHLGGKYPRPVDVPAPIWDALNATATCTNRIEGDGGSTADTSSNADDGTTDWAALRSGGSVGVRACDRFLVLQDRYFACDKVPQQAKDAMKQSMDQQEQAWSMLKDPGIPEEAKRAAGDGCRAGADALIQSAAVMGCSLL
ncbi:MAG: hypothetical protein K8W52_05885 [Deltaproteobacteria bacterium]|nr:hypothetical protein [Deltaproteobacteria bacterium]